MSLEQLHQSLSKATDKGNLALTGDLLGSPAIGELFARAWPDHATMTLTGASVKLSPKGRSLRVTGKVALANLPKATASVVFTLSGGKLGMTATVKMPAKLKLPKLFGALGDAALEALVVNGGKVVLNSRARKVSGTRRKLKPGMYLAGTIKPVAVYPYLGIILNADDEVSLAGPITDISLPLFDFSTTKLNGTLVGVDLPAISFGFAMVNIADDGDTPIALPRTSVSANLEVGGGTGSVSAILPAADAALLSFRADFDNLTLGSITELADFLGPADPFNALPAPVSDEITKIGGAFALNSMDMQVNVAKPAFTAIDLDVVVDLKGFKVFSLIPDLAITELDLSLRVDNSASTARFSYGAVATIEIGGNYDVLLGFQTQSSGGYEISVAQAPGSTLKLADVLTTFVPDLTGFPEFDVESFRLTILPETKQYSFAATISSDWDLLESPQLTLTEIDVHASYNANLSAKVSGGVRGLLALKVDEDPDNDIHITLAADRPPGAKGWDLSGHTGNGEIIPIGHLISAVTHKFSATASVPDFLDGQAIENLDLSFNTEDREFQFGTSILLPFSDDFVLPLTVSLHVEPLATSGFDASFRGTTQISKSQFAIVFDHKTSGGDTLIATYQPAGGGSRKLALKDDLLAQITHNEDLLDLVPPVEISLDGAILARLAPAEGDAVNVMGVALGAKTSLDLTALPLVGAMAKAAGLSPQTGVGDLQILIASGPVAADQIDAANAVLAGDEANLHPNQIPVQDAPGGDEKDTRAGLGKGFNFRGTMNLGDGPVVISAGGSAEADAQEPAPEDKAADAAAKDAPDKVTSPVAAPAGDATWFSIQKKLGPLYFEKIGVTYRDHELWLLPAADLTLAGLTIGLEGLAISSPLDHFSPTFHLSGLSIDFRKGPLEIGGAFQRFQTGDHDEYLGALVLKTETLSLSAMGAYAPKHKVPDDGTGKPGEVGPSMFVYLELDYPLGGPPFFFVEGLSAGFGYNRSLTIPPIKRLGEFPFIASATGAAPPDEGAKTPGENMAAVRGSLQAKIAGLHEWVGEEQGQNWLAAGIKFTSFKIVDGFALLTVAFGHRLDIHLLGSATYFYPPGSGETGHPLTRIEVLVDAAYLPEEGTLTVSAEIAPGSYVFDPDCHLVGGLAFKTWFKEPHKDDFVLTIGGYHKDFKVPSHYPNADRLAFNWQKSSELSIKGGIYFAMTPNYLMAGGFLDATWESGALKAWLKITADFLIRYKPFHYDASMSIDIGAEVTIHFFGTHHLSVHLGADLHIWGPPFSGTASFDIWVASFSVSFGEGADPPPPIPWHQFHDSFLPQKRQVIALAVADGLVKTIKRARLDPVTYSVDPSEDDADTHWVINPRHFCVQVNLTVPQNQAPGRDDNAVGQVAGIAPMHLDKGALYSRLSYALDFKLKGKPPASLLEDFSFETIKGNLPAGLWGNSFELEENSDAIVAGAATAVLLKPGVPLVEGSKIPIDRDELAFETEDIPDAWAWRGETALAGNCWSELNRGWPDAQAAAKFTADAAAPKARLAMIQAALGRSDLTGGLHADDLLVAAYRRPQ